MKKSNTQIAWWISGLVFIIHFLPYFIFPGDAYIRIHDTLEGEWIWLHLLKETGTAWNTNPNTIIPQVMNGLPRSAMPTGFSAMMLSVELFGTYWGYILNYMFVHCIGFITMYFFLRRWIFKNEEQKHLSIYIALIFSLIPVYSPFGITVMGQPLLLHVFLLSLQNKAKYYHFLLLIIFPLYSSLVWAGIPILISLGLFWIYIIIKNKKLFGQYLFGTIILGIGYALVNYNVLQLVLSPPDGFISHRTAYNLYMFGPPEFMTLMIDFIHQFFTIHYHVGTMLTLPILIIIGVVLKKKHTTIRNILLLIICIVIFQAGYGFFEYLIGSKIDAIKSFRINRFNILLPILWTCGLALAFKLWFESRSLKKVMPTAIVCLLIITAVGNDEILNNYRLGNLPSFKKYMAIEQFSEIKDYIDDDPSTYRVACLGMNPSILQYNGFYTIDGLQSVYDLNHKNRFGKIFSKEMEKSDVIKQYFEGWGNRCCIFSSSLGKDWNAFMVSKDITQITISLNAQAFKEVGGKYLISAAPLTFEESSFNFLKKFDDERSYWNLYLYQVK